METIFSEIPENRRHHKNRSHPKKDTRIKFVSPSRSPSPASSAAAAASSAASASASAASDSEFESRSSSSSESIVESSLVREAVPDAHEIIDLVSDEPNEPKLLPRPQEEQEQWLHRQAKEDEFEDDQVDEIIVSLDPPKRQKKQLEAPGAPKKPKKSAYASFVGRVQNGIAAATDALIEQIGIMNDRVMDEAKNLAREAAARRDEAEARAHEAKKRQDEMQKCSRTIVAGLREFERLTKPNDI